MVAMVCFLSVFYMIWLVLGIPGISGKVSDVID